MILGGSSHGRAARLRLEADEDVLHVVVFVELAEELVDLGAVRGVHLHRVLRLPAQRSVVHRPLRGGERAADGVEVGELGEEAGLTRLARLEILRAGLDGGGLGVGARRRRRFDDVPFWVIVRHALPLALTPIVSYLGPALAGNLEGGVVVEKIFFVPGMGQFFLSSAQNRDLTMAIACVIIYSVVLLILNLVVDLIYPILDPRVELK